MTIHVTARRFRARKELRDYATQALKRMDKFYDGILRADVILSYERSSSSVKNAEINLHVEGATLSAKEKSEEFTKSIELALEKLERQVAKFKMRQRMKNRKTLRRVKEDVTEESPGDAE